MIENSAPTNTFNYQVDDNKKPTNQKLVYVGLGIAILAVVMLLAKNYSSYRDSAMNGDMSGENAEYVVDEAALRESIETYSGNYQTVTDAAPGEEVDLTSTEPEPPLRISRALTLSPDMMASMEYMDDSGQQVVEMGVWSFNQESNTVRVDFTQGEATRMIVFEAVNGNTLQSQAYDKSIYPDTDMRFVKN
jgi:hypothetical protein